MTKTFTWATVTGNSPLRVMLDGDTAALPVTPDSLVDPLTLTAGDRVRCETSGRRVIVNGRSGGGRSSLGRRNLIRNARGRVNQRAAASGISLASGAYFIDGWKSGAATNAVTWTGSDAAGRVITVPASKSIQQDIEQADVLAANYVLVNFGTAQGRVYNAGASAPAYATASASAPLIVALDGTANARVEFGPGTVSNPVLVRADGWSGLFPDVSLADDLRICQRFFYQGPYTTTPYVTFNSGNALTGTVSFPVPMRAAPTITPVDAAGASGKVSIENAGGSRQNGIAPPTSLNVTTTGFAWVAGGLAGTTGSSGMLEMNSYTASADL